jgi:outer membrane protein TolC
MHGSNPELQALGHSVRAAELYLDLEKAQRWPALQLGANYLVQGQWSNEAYPNSDQLAHSSAVTVGLTYPLFDGFNAKSRIDRAKADLRTAELERDRMTREKELSVRVSRLTVVDAIAALQGRREAVGLAEEAYRLAEVRLANGLATPLERLDAELALTTARGQYVQALYVANIAEAALELTVGGDAAASPAGSDRKEYGDE